MMFSAMLTDAFQGADAGFPIRYRFDGKLLNLRTGCNPNPRCRQMWLISSSMQMTWQKMQGAVDRMSKACDNFQLTIST